MTQGRQISQILGILSPDLIKKAASRPNDPQSVKQVEKVIQRAEKQGERIDPSVVSEAGGKFVDAARSTPEAWKAALALLNYKSFLNVNYVPSLEPNTLVDQTWIQTHYTIPRLTAYPNYQVSWLGDSHPPDVPALHRLGSPDENANLMAGPRFLLIKNARLVLDGMFMRNIIIQDSHVVYRGAPIEMENVYFVNCTFDVIREVRGQQFAKAIFSLSASTTMSAGG